MLKKILLALLIVLIISQFFPANLPKVTAENPADLIANNSIPDEVAKILHESCYDCHSNETIYPWYSYVSPVKFLVSKDTRKGRKHVNFSEWENYNKADKLEALDDFGDEVDEGEMPMEIYTVMHSNSKLSDADRELLVAWAGEFAESLFDK